jgi:cytochrome c-type biogenesis protein CcmH
VDADAPKALALMGAAQFRLGRPQVAISYLQRLRTQLPDGSEEATQISSVIDRITAELAKASDTTGASDAKVAMAPDTSAEPKRSGVASAQEISGTVRITAALQARMPADATLFIVARAPEGPRIPYAVLRQAVGRFPLSFTLSDAQAMDPSRPLSGAASVVLEARISISGNALRQPGDLIGSSAPIAPGARDVALIIDRVVE